MRSAVEEIHLTCCHWWYFCKISALFCFSPITVLWTKWIHSASYNDWCVWSKRMVRGSLRLLRGEKLRAMWELLHISDIHCVKWELICMNYQANSVICVEISASRACINFEYQWFWCPEWILLGMCSSLLKLKKTSLTLNNFFPIPHLSLWLLWHLKILLCYHIYG